jgi:sporulation protein YtfJ
MAENKPLSDLMGITMDKVKSMVSADSIIGTPITTPDGTMIIPVSKVSYGFASGGSDLPKGTQTFAGGGGAGITMDPVAFLVVKDGAVRVMQINAHPNTVDKIVDSAPDVIDKINGMIADNKAKKEKTE